MLRLVLVLSVLMHAQTTNGHMSSQVELTDWDSTLYGQAMCVAIPRTMGLCQNIHYGRMKVPNLLGHETVPEIVEQSAAWNPLLGIACHRDAQLFLCSLFAPVCIEQAAQTTIYPCRSLCERVRRSCEAPMLAYNYPWPGMFNCSQFPEENGLCIKPSSSDQLVQEANDVVSSEAFSCWGVVMLLVTMAYINRRLVDYIADNINALFYISNLIICYNYITSTLI